MDSIPTKEEQTMTLKKKAALLGYRRLDKARGLKLGGSDGPNVSIKSSEATMTTEEREALEAEYLKRLAELDMARWKQHLAHGENAAPEVPLDDDQRNMQRKLRRVFHAPDAPRRLRLFQKRDEA
jgi:hypothetical protein